MASRYTICLLFATWLGVSNGAWAQSMPYWQTQTGAPEQGFPAMPGPPANGYAPMSYHPGMSGDPGAIPPGIMDGSFVDPNYCPPGMGPMGQANYLDYNAPIHEEVWDKERPIERFLGRVFTESWIRLEYLHWNATGPTGALGAANTQFSDNPYIFNPVFDDQANLIGYGKVMKIDDIDLENNQGIRGTYGTTTTFGGIEMNFWGLAQNTDTLVADFLPDTTIIDLTDPFFPILPFPVPLFVATTTNLDGQISNNVFLWDLSYRADFTTDYWGTEFKVLFDQPNWSDNLYFQTMLGFQYVYAHENLRQEGFSTAGNLGRIGSKVQNNFYGPTLGVRAEHRTDRLTLGVEPKVALAANSYEGVVTTSQLRNINDPDTYDYAQNTTFAPVLQLAAYARWRFNDTFNMYVSFDGTWLTRMARAHTSIDYNDRGDNNPPAIGYREGLEGVFLNGLTIGGEVVLP